MKVQERLKGRKDAVEKEDNTSINVLEPFSIVETRESGSPSWKTVVWTLLTLIPLGAMKLASSLRRIMSRSTIRRSTHTN
jgi:hypothetical protein